MNVQRVFRFFDVRTAIGLKDPGFYAPIGGGSGVAQGLSQAGYAIKGQKLQSFAVQIFVAAGPTFQHRYIGDGGLGSVAAYPSYCDRIIGFDTQQTFRNTPTVSSSVGFVAGGGISANTFICNVADQDPSIYWGWVTVSHYDGGSSGATSRPRPQARFASRNVNGVTRNRLEISFTDDLSGAAWTLNTTNLPSGRQVQVHFIGGLL